MFRRCHPGEQLRRGLIRRGPLDLAVEGTVDRKDGVTRFTEIVLTARLTLPPGADLDRARRILDKGKTACLVTASLSTPLLLEAEIVVAS
jgi:hypothetical protein